MMANDWKSKYDYVGPFEEGLARVNVGGKYREDDDRGWNVHAPVGGQWGFVDETGKEVIPPKYDEADEFYEGLAKVKLNGKWGLINQSDRYILDPLYDAIVRSSSAQRFQVEMNGKWGIFDSLGNPITKINFESIWIFCHGLAEFQLGGKWGYLNTLGEVVIAAKYDMVWGFDRGYSSVSLGSKHGLIDLQGNELWFDDKIEANKQCEILRQNYPNQ
ncbi:MAG: WG repeat-containing protein [Holophagaceae bacterium]